MSESKVIELKVGDIVSFNGEEFKLLDNGLLDDESSIAGVDFDVADEELCTGDMLLHMRPHNPLDGLRVLKTVKINEINKTQLKEVFDSLRHGHTLIIAEPK